MNRREHLKASATLIAGLCAASPLGAVARERGAPGAPLSDEGRVMTVTGPIAPEQMGTALPHEHVASRFGADPERRPSYDVAALFEAVVPALRRIKELGCDTVACATAAYFGRDPLILKQLSEMTGVQILTNTGYYGAADDRYVPDHAYDETADQLAGRWLAEWEGGVDGTGIRPGFIKTAVDGAGEGKSALSAIDRKLVRAAAREQLAVLDEEVVAPEAWIWVHAQNAAGDLDALAEAAGRGAWIEFDDVGTDTIDEHVALVRQMKRRGLLGRVLLSHDGNTFPIAKWSPRPYDTLFTDFFPALRAAGVSEAEVRRLTVVNPREAFTVRVRSA